MSEIDCLIAIPCFRESKRLPAFLENLCAALSATPFRSQIVVVDDGSGPREAEMLRDVIAAARERWPGLVAAPLLLPTNVGKGGAVYAAWQSPVAARAKLLCFVDADGSVPAGEVVRLIRDLLSDMSGHWSALYGSRVKMLGHQVDRLAYRHYIGRVFATLVTAFTGLTVYDSQCGLKVVRREAYQAIADDLQETRFVFDVELTLHLLRRGFTVREVPVAWREIPGSKVHLFRDSLQMALGLLRIRRRLQTLDPSA